MTRTGSTGTAGHRTFHHTRLLRITPDAYDRAVTLLADAARTLDPAAVIGIANGGITPATDIAAQLDVAVHLVHARHNPTDAIHTAATGVVTHHLTALDATLTEAPNGAVLLVDDICGTGATFDAVVPALQTRLGPSAPIHTVTLCRNAGSTQDPDLWIWTVDDWVLFPWETTPDSTLPIHDLPPAITVSHR